MNDTNINDEHSYMVSFLINGKEFVYLNSKHPTEIGTIFRQSLAIKQLIDEGIYELKPNMNHPINQRLLKCP